MKIENRKPETHSSSDGFPSGQIYKGLRLYPIFNGISSFPKNALLGTRPEKKRKEKLKDEKNEKKKKKRTNSKERI